MVISGIGPWAGIVARLRVICTSGGSIICTVRRDGNGGEVDDDGGERAGWRPCDERDGFRIEREGW